MKKCPICDKIYRDYDQYCIKCNYKLQQVEGSKVEDYPPEAHTPSTPIKSTPTVSCPYCKSTNTKKITSTEKAVNIALFGIFGNKRKYQWHCNNCKSDF